MIQKVINNFYLRNLAILLLYISPEIFQTLTNYNKVSNDYLIKITIGGVAFYLYFVFHNRVLYEKLLLQKKYLLYAVAFFITFTAYREGISYIIWLITRPPSETVYVIEEIKNHRYLFFFFLYWTDLIYIYVSLGIYLAFKYAKERTRILEIENARKELELKRLNEQLNPHFLFNALNNIYSYQIREMDNGKELVLKLSELMRYVIDISKKDTVPLDEEIKFIENYLAFEQERVGKRCTIAYTKNISNTDFNIVPLIFFNFIENAFKHGTTSMHPSEITININADENSLRLYIVNTIFDDDIVSTQTGIDNATQRLALVYPGKHDLSIQQADGKYVVTLSLNNIS